MNIFLKSFTLPLCATAATALTSWVAGENIISNNGRFYICVMISLYVLSLARFSHHHNNRAKHRNFQKKSLQHQAIIKKSLTLPKTYKSFYNENNSKNHL